MKKNNTEQLLRSMNELRAGSGLRARLAKEMYSLAPVVRQSYSLTMFRLAIAGLVAALLLGVGTGVVAAAKGSHPGSILYPLKKVIVQTQIKLTDDPVKKKALQQEVENPSIEPTEPVASPTAKPRINVKEHEDQENEKEVEGVSTSAAPLQKIKISGEKEDGNKNHVLQIIPRHSDDDSSDSDN